MSGHDPQHLLVISPFIFPVLMILLGLLVGMVQAYIFGILATVSSPPPLRRPALKFAIYDFLICDFNVLFVKGGEGKSKIKIKRQKHHG